MSGLGPAAAAASCRIFERARYHLSSWRYSPRLAQDDASNLELPVASRCTVRRATAGPMAQVVGLVVLAFGRRREHASAQPAGLRLASVGGCSWTSRTSRLHLSRPDSGPTSPSHGPTGTAARAPGRLGNTGSGMNKFELDHHRLGVRLLSTGGLGRGREARHGPGPARRPRCAGTRSARPLSGPHATRSPRPGPVDSRPPLRLSEWPARKPKPRRR